MKIHKSTRLHDENNIREVGRFSKLYRAMVTIEVVCRKKKKEIFIPTCEQNATAGLNPLVQVNPNKIYRKPIE